MTSFTVRRSEWLRGKRASQLVRNAGVDPLSRCCLGFYGNQICELSDMQMTGILSPERVRAVEPWTDERWGGLLEHFGNTVRDSKVCERIMATNDSPYLTDAMREHTLTEDFATLNVSILFVD